MELIGDIIRITGIVCVAAGFVVEALGVIAISSYSLRRHLPVYASPFTLIGYGGTAFVLGAILVAVGGALARVGSA